MANPVSVVAAPAVDTLIYVRQQYKRFSFFQLCGLLEAVALQRNKKVRYQFKSNPALVSQSTDIEALEIAEHRDAIDCEFTLNFIGLMGAASPLPIHYTERLLHDDQDDNALAAFYDFFNHRLIELRYRIWQKYHYLHAYRVDGQDVISQYLSSLCGLAGLPAEITALPMHSLYPFIPMLLGKQVDKQHIAMILEAYFGFTHVRLEQNKLRRTLIPLNNRFLIGKQGSRLGTDTIVGASLYDRQYHFTVHIYLNNPLAFLPYQLAFQRLVVLIRYLVQAPLQFDVQLHCESELPPVLSRAAHSYLGWTLRLSKQGSKMPLVIPLSVRSD